MCQASQAVAGDGNGSFVTPLAEYVLVAVDILHQGSALLFYTCINSREPMAYLQ